MELNLDIETKRIKESFHSVSDLIIREIRTDYCTANVFYIDGMIDANELYMSVMKPLVETNKKFEPNIEGVNGVVTCSSQVMVVEDYQKTLDFIAGGDAIILFENAKEYIMIGVRRPNSRTTSEPPTSTTIKGPREGFVEDIKSNIVLLRRKLKSNNFTYTHCDVGRSTKTCIFICYLDNVAKKPIVNKIVKRIKEIDIDGIIDSSQISKFLESKPYSIFKQVGNNEKPDVIAKKLLEGKIAIIVEGSPIVLTLPYLMIEDFEAVQDNYKRVTRVDFVRIIRLLGVFFAVYLPPVFVAVQTYHYQLIPPKLLFTILNAVEGIPFSPTVEMFIALILFEILGETSIRMPRYVGMAISVVGALVLGQTAVNAGLLSSLTILIVALSAIGLYAIPDEVGSFSILRLAFVVISGIMGLMGLVAVTILIIVYLLDFEEYGVPYLAPIAPLFQEEMKSFLLKPVTPDEIKRAKFLNLENKTKQKKISKGDEN